MTDILKITQKEFDEMCAELRLARERLGPAGYKLLIHYKNYKRAVEVAREALNEVGHEEDCLPSKNISCVGCDTRQALTEIDKILSGEETK